MTHNWMRLDTSPPSAEHFHTRLHMWMICIMSRIWRVIAHMGIRHDAQVNELRHTCGWVMSHIWKGADTHTNESRDTHMNESRDTHMNESWDTHMNESWCLGESRVTVGLIQTSLSITHDSPRHTHMWMSNTQKNESWRTCGRVPHSLTTSTLQTRRGMWHYKSRHNCEWVVTHV